MYIDSTYSHLNCDGSNAVYPQSLFSRTYLINSDIYFIPSIGFTDLIHSDLGELNGYRTATRHPSALSNYSAYKPSLSTQVGLIRD